MSTLTVATCRAQDPTTCPYHSNVVKMQAAKAAFQFDAYADAREALRQALVTDKFAREELHRDEQQGITPPVTFDDVAQEQTALEARVAREERTPVRTSSNQRTTVPESSVTVPAAHTYKESVRKKIPNNHFNSWVGEKYDPNMPPSTVVKNIKHDFAAAQAAGYLPAGLSISARKDTYSGGYAINVEVSGVKDKDRYDYDTRGNVMDETADFSLVEKRVRRIVDAYNMYHRDSFTNDYATINFGGSTQILDDNMQAFHAAEKARAAQLRGSKKAQHELKDAYARDGSAALIAKGFVITGKTADDKPVGRIPGTSFVGIVDRNHLNGNEVYRMFNLHGTDEATAGGFEANAATMRSNRIRSQFRKQTFIG